MTTPSKPKTKDNSFSSFAVGVSVGVAASFLFGTEDGRKLVKRLMDAIPEKYKIIPNPSVISSGVERSHSTQFHSTNHPTPIIPTQETPHHATYDPSLRYESPPPPPPLVHPSRPEPFRPQ